MSEPTIHILKCVEPYLSAIRDGSKTFEVREYREQRCRDVMNCPACSVVAHCNSTGRELLGPPPKCLRPKPARNFKVGDCIQFDGPDPNQWARPLPDINSQRASINQIYRITYILWDIDFPQAIKPGWCVLGIAPLEDKARWEGDKFIECASCRIKLGSPILCNDCSKVRSRGNL